MRSTPLVSGSFTSTIATSKPRARAIASASSPRDAVTTSIVLDAARPSESSALMSTACSDPTSSTLSSTMSTRARVWTPAWRRVTDATAASSGEPEELLQDVVDQLRVRRALGLLHDLADEEAHQAGLAGPELLGLLGVLLDDLLADGLDGALRRSPAAFRAATRPRREPRRCARDLGVDLLGLLAADAPSSTSRNSSATCVARTGMRESSPCVCTSRSTSLWTKFATLVALAALAALAGSP